MEGDLHKGHRQRMRERFERAGLDGFADHEVLEYLLFFAFSRRNTNDLAHRLLKKFGSLTNVLNAPAEQICSVPGMGDVSASLLTLMPQLFRRCFVRDTALSGPIANARQCAAFVRALFHGHRNELFYCLCLDARNRITSCPLISEGTVDETTVYPRRVIEAVLANGAHGVILAHNHPGGHARPTAEDRQLTREIAAALGSIGVQVQDHIIVAGDECYSINLGSAIGAGSQGLSPVAPPRAAQGNRSARQSADQLYEEYTDEE